MKRDAQLGVVAVSALVAGLLACTATGNDDRATGPVTTTSPGRWTLDKVVPGEDLPADTVLARVSPLRVLVRVDGAPAGGVAVAWITSGNGAGTDTTKTAPDGTASLNFAFGSKVGTYVVQAVLPQRPEVAALNFSGKATAGHPATLRAVSGAGQTDSATARLHDDLVVEASDGHGNVTAGATIDWVVTAGGGSVAQPQTTTGDDGKTATRYTLGRSAGAQSIDATLHGGDAKVRFNADATAGNPAKLTVVSGNNQSAETNHTLASDFVVKASDSYDNPVAGAAIDWTIASGGGSLSATQGRTAVNGLAATRSTLGPLVGTQSVKASLAEWPTAPIVEFSATATAPPPPPPQPTVILVSGGGQAGFASMALPLPLVFRALDAAGQPFSGQTIRFAAPGAVSPTSATTDGQGFAQTIWTLGPTVGLQTIVATASFNGAAATTTAVANPPPLVITNDPLDFGVPVMGSIGVNQFTAAAVAPASRTPVAADVTVTLSHRSHASVPPSVTIPAGTTYGRFHITGGSIGTDTIVASAPGFTSATFIVTVGLGTIFFLPASQYPVGAKISTTLCSAGPNGNETYVASPTGFSIAASPNIQIFDIFGNPNGSVSFPIPGANCLFFYIKGLSAGPATLTASNPNYRPSTLNIVVSP